jgi:hypothetical protein
MPAASIGRKFSTLVQLLRSTSMKRTQLVSNMIALRKEIRIELYKLAHENSSTLEQFMTYDRLPAYVWVYHQQFASLHEEYVALKYGINSLI